jgi:hypothetical protein
MLVVSLMVSAAVISVLRAGCVYGMVRMPGFMVRMPGFMVCMPV